MPGKLPAVDAYIANAAPFAQPLLTHVRKLFHKTVPEIEEQMKWSRPFFMYKGIILGNLAAFKAHCSFGFWGEEIAAKLRSDGVASNQGMGSFGHIASLKELPTDKQFTEYIRHAVAVIDDGTRTQSLKRPPRVAKAELAVPKELIAALKQNKAAQKVFDSFPPSCRREYIDWITSAKREETRAQRVEQTVAWAAEGKRRNWKYENC